MNVSDKTPYAGVFPVAPTVFAENGDLDLPVARRAARQYQEILPLTQFRKPAMRADCAKTVMMEGGVIRSDTVRHPLQPLHPATRRGLLELAREVNPLALTWGR